MISGTGFNYTQSTKTTRRHPSNFTSFSAIKGLDTTITFFIVDDKNKPVSLSDKQVVATVIKDYDKTKKFTKNLKSISDIDGVASLTITSADTTKMQIGLYEIVLTYKTSHNETTAVHVDLNFRASYILRLVENVIPTEVNASDISLFLATGTGNIAVSGQVAGSSTIGTRSGLNTIAIYTAAATGSVFVEATLASEPGIYDWFEIPLTPTQNAAQFVNDTDVTSFVFEGNYTYVRFKTDLTSGKVDKIQYSI
jgi:hypothetical protein